MSFSKEVKEELSKMANLANKDEVLYEFLGYLASNNILVEKNITRFSTENDYNIDRFAKITRNTGIEDFDINVNGKKFFIEIKNSKLKNIPEIDFKSTKTEYEKAFIRGLFMGSGSINNPEQKYHLECGIRDEKQVDLILKLMEKNDIYLKKKENIIYIKEGEEISKFLAFIGASKSVLKFEEIRVQRNMNNKVNRIVNCEAANLNKILNASVEQINAIRKLKKNGKFEKLDDNLKEIANLRLEYPDMPLIELGKKLNEPLGKSGVNYRLKKIVELANK